MRYCTASSVDSPPDLPADKHWLGEQDAHSTDLDRLCTSHMQSQGSKQSRGAGGNE